MTKLLTGTAILQLYETGLLDLNASVITYLPSLSSVIQQNLKVIDTLRHTTGVDERMLNIFIANNRGVKESLIEASRILWTEQLVPAPDSRITYSNLGVTIMGAVVKSISQQTLSTYFQQNILKPLNMSVLKFHYDMEGDFTNICYPRIGPNYESYQVRTTPSGDIYTTPSMEWHICFRDSTITIEPFYTKMVACLILLAMLVSILNTRKESLQHQQLDRIAQVNF